MSNAAGLTQKISLEGAWRCKPFLGDDWLWRNAHRADTRDVHGWFPATVPGSVYTDLQRAGEIPDPHWDRNSRLLEWVPARTWVYRLDFQSEPGPCVLVFKGVDYRCTVFLNGEELGSHDGMFSRFEFPVELAAQNALAVVVQPAPFEEPQVGRTSRVRTHKARMSYGWDFCPRLVHLGIWREVYLRWGPEAPRPRVHLSADRQLATVSCGDKGWEIERPRLWSPQDPYLYEHEGQRYGIRDVRWVSNDEAPAGALPYTLVLNGQKTYLKGWNWVPVDALDFSRDPARLLRMARHANVNLLRVWGGGLIESERFYDLCDELGILVWQEFSLSSSGIESTPSDDPAYLELLRREARPLVEDLAHHPALVLWCGGNELQTPEGSPLCNHPALDVLREAVGDCAWLPTSPSGPTFLLRPGEENHDVHGPWEHQGLQRQYELYNQSTSLLHSEFGVEGMSRLETLRRTIPAEHLWPATRANPHYAHRGAWWINEPLIQECFGGIDDLATLVRASQYLQAEGLRYALESNLRRRSRNSGSIPWQFNEPFPNAYCTSAVEYDGTPKPVYYCVRRAYSEPCTASFDACVLHGKELSYRLHEPVRAEVRTFGDLVFLLLPDNRYLFSRTSNLRPMLEAPPTRVLREGNTLTNAGDYPALNVWLQSDELLSDNYFHLMPGESRTMEGAFSQVSWWNAPPAGPPDGSPRSLGS